MSVFRFSFRLTYETTKGKHRSKRKYVFFFELVLHLPKVKRLFLDFLVSSRHLGFFNGHKQLFTVKNVKM